MTAKLTLSLEKDVIYEALDSGIQILKMQYNAAFSAGIGIFLTRNKKDYRKSQLQILDSKIKKEKIKALEQVERGMHLF